jgi:hypothetical protein
MSDREPIDCPQARQLLALHAGSDLEEALAAELERHLAACEPCRAERSLLVLARERIAVLGAHTARSAAEVDLWPAIGARLASERAPAAPARRARPTAWVPLSLAAAAAVIALVWWRASGAGDPQDQPAPGAPPPQLVVDTPGAAPRPEDALRRAGPEDELLRDSANPYSTPLRTGAQRSPNALAGYDLR